MKRKILLVTFPVDLGSETLQANLVSMLERNADLEHHIFSPHERPELGATLSQRRKGALRLAEVPRLAALCSRAKRMEQTILFQCVSPATFSLPFIAGVENYIFVDWTRKLFEPITGRRATNPALTALHCATMRAASGVLPFTEAVRASVIDGYGVSAGKVHKVPLPLDVEGAPMATPNPEGPLRMLFVGGDFVRKGGEALLRWHGSHRGPRVELTVMTQSDIPSQDGVRIIRNDPRQTAKGQLSQADLFVLPTKYDAFPMAIGEAASAGLGVVTTQNALGAREVIDECLNGHVVADEADLFKVLTALASDRAAIERYKPYSRKKMLARFTFDKAYGHLEDVIASLARGGTPGERTVADQPVRPGRLARDRHRRPAKIP